MGRMKSRPRRIVIEPGEPPDEGRDDSRIARDSFQDNGIAGRVWTTNNVVPIHPVLGRRRVGPTAKVALSTPPDILRLAKNEARFGRAKSLSSFVAEAVDEKLHRDDRSAIARSA